MRLPAVLPLERHMFPKQGKRTQVVFNSCLLDSAVADLQRSSESARNGHMSKPTPLARIEHRLDGRPLPRTRQTDERTEQWLNTGSDDRAVAEIARQRQRSAEPSATADVRGGTKPPNE